jgi:hypothetical protein
MQHTIYQYFLGALIGFLLIGPCPTLCAQTTDPWQDMQRMMQQLRTQMQRGMSQFDSTFAGGRIQMRIAPDSSFFFFHSDTTFRGDGSDQRNFRFEPFERGFSMPDFDNLFDDFFDLGQPMPRQRPNRQPSPSDDGNRNADDLLPEERLRQTDSAQPGQSKPAPPPVKYKTYRL